MANLENLKSTPGSRHSNHRVGRGRSSGMGKTSKRGQDGQKSRKSGGTRLGFEGGQTPLYRRIPKRGFTNFTKVNYATISVSRLNDFEGKVVTIQALKEQKLLKSRFTLLKIIGNDKLNKALTVKADKLTAGAKASIEEAGGKVSE